MTKLGLFSGFKEIYLCKLVKYKHSKNLNKYYMAMSE